MHGPWQLNGWFSPTHEWWFKISAFKKMLVLSSYKKKIDENPFQPQSLLHVPRTGFDTQVETYYQTDVLTLVICR